MLAADPFHDLALAAVAWVAIHAGISGSPLRPLLARKLGEKGFQLFFSVLSLAVLVWLCRAYARAPCEPLWSAPRALYWLPMALMPAAFVLLAGAFSTPNPTSVGQESALERDDAARGVLRITRHPFLVAVAAWSAVHLIVNGNLASLLFFGSMLTTAVLGTRDIDHKRRRKDPAGFARYRERTSTLPFAAIVRGKNRLVVRELWVPLVAGLVLTLLALTFHAYLFRVSPLPVRTVFSG